MIILKRSITHICGIIHQLFFNLLNENAMIHSKNIQHNDKLPYGSVNNLITYQK